VRDLQGYCTHSGCQEGRPRESTRGSAWERMGAWSVRGARARGEARAICVRDLPYMLGEGLCRTPRRAFVALLPERRCTRAVASLLSLKREYQNLQPRLRLLSAHYTHDGCCTTARSDRRPGRYRSARITRHIPRK
jgi:hypothetical protein